MSAWGDVSSVRPQCDHKPCCTVPSHRLLGLYDSPEPSHILSRFLIDTQPWQVESQEQKSVSLSEWNSKRIKNWEKVASNFPLCQNMIKQFTVHWCSSAYPPQWNTLLYLWPPQFHSMWSCLRCQWIQKGSDKSYLSFCYKVYSVRQ